MQEPNVLTETNISREIYLKKKLCICYAGINVFAPPGISPPTFINGDINILEVQHAINLGTVLASNLIRVSITCTHKARTN